MQKPLEFLILINLLPKKILKIIVVNKNKSILSKNRLNYSNQNLSYTNKLNNIRVKRATFPVKKLGTQFFCTNKLN